MKRSTTGLITALLFAFSGSCGCAVGQNAGAAKDIRGTWKGTAHIQDVDLPMVIRLRKQSDGAYSGTFDSPTQHSGKMVMDKLTVNNGQIHFEVSTIQFSFDGAVTANSKTIDGVWKQRAVSMSITLTKDKAASAITQPPSGSKAPAAGSKQDIAGAWQGASEVGGTLLHMIMRFVRAEDGGYFGTFESPDQHSGQIEMDVLKVKDGQIHFELNELQFSFDGTLKPDAKHIDGTWSQRAVTMAISLTKS